MKALFVHDHRFQVSEDGEVFSIGSFPYVVWQRYLEFFDSLVVLARKDGFKNESDRLISSSGQNVSFVFAQNAASIKARLQIGSRIKQLISEQIHLADAVIVRLPSQLGFIAVSILSRLNKPYLIEVVGCPRDAYWFHGSLLGKIYAPIAMRQQQRALRGAKLALYVSRQFLPDRYPCAGQLAFASNVELPKINEALTGRRLSRLEAQENGKIPVFGTIGSLASKYKGIDTVFAAMSRISIPFEYRILGPGDQTYWKNLADKYGVSDRVFFDGVLPAGQPVLEWLDDIDVYLQPSLTEGLPRSVIEALSRGCVAIGSQVGAMAELVPEKLIHGPKKVDELKSIISDLLKDPTSLRQYSERGPKIAMHYRTDLLREERSKIIRKLSDSV